VVDISVNRKKYSHYLKIKYMHFTDKTKVKELEIGRCYWNENQQPVYTLRKRDIHTCCWNENQQPVFTVKKRDIHTCYWNFSGRYFCK